MWGERCTTYLGMRRYEHALAEAERALAADPSYVWALVARGTINLLTGRPAEALADFDRAVEGAERPPGLASVIARRGTVHLLRGDESRALADFDRALAEGGPAAALLALKAGFVCAGPGASTRHARRSGRRRKRVVRPSA